MRAFSAATRARKKQRFPRFEPPVERLEPLQTPYARGQVRQNDASEQPRRRTLLARAQVCKNVSERITHTDINARIKRENKYRNVTASRGDERGGKKK